MTGNRLHALLMLSPLLALSDERRGDGLFVPPPSGPMLDHDRSTRRTEFAIPSRFGGVVTTAQRSITVFVPRRDPEAKRARKKRFEAAKRKRRKAGLR